MYARGEIANNVDAAKSFYPWALLFFHLDLGAITESW